MAREHFAQTRGVFGQMLERHRTALDQADRRAIALQRHRDAQRGSAHLAQRRLPPGVGKLDHPPRLAQVADQFDQPRQLPEQTVAIVAAEFDQQHRLRRAPAILVQRRLERPTQRRLDARQLDHPRIEQLDRRGRELHHVLHAVHRRMEAREADRPEHPGRRQPRQLQVQSAKTGERSLGTDQQVRQVHRAVGGVRVLRLRMKHVEVVAAHRARRLRPAAPDLVTLARADLEQARHQRAAARRGHRAPRIGAERSEVLGGAVRQDRVDPAHVVRHAAVDDRARPASVVAGHAAERGLRRRRDVDREAQPVRLEPAIEPIQDDPGLDLDGHRIAVERDHLVQVPAVVDDQHLADALAAPAGAAAARQDRHARLARQVDRGHHVRLRRRAPPRPPDRPARSTHRWRSARARMRRTAPRP